MTAVDTTLVAPWAADTPTLLTRTLSHTATVTAVLPDGTEVPLELEAGRVSFDESRVPRVEATLTCRMPMNTADADQLDPRTGVRLLIDAGYVRPNSVVDSQPLVDLGLRSRKVRRPTDVLELTARSDEAVVLDDAPAMAGTITGASTFAAIEAIVQRVLPTATVFYDSGPVTGTITVAPITDWWATLADLSDRLGCHTYDDGSRTWHVGLAPTSVAAAPAAHLNTGPTGTVVEVDDELSRDDEWHNRLQLTYRWRDNAGNQRQIVATRQINSGPWAATTGNTKGLEVTREVPTTIPQAIAAADALVGRGATRGRLVRLTAVAAYWVRPGHTVEVTLPGTGITESQLVAAVEFDLRTGLMDVSARMPDNLVAAGSAQGVIVDDDFERPDGTLGYPNIGPAWITSSFSIAGGLIDQSETTSVAKLALIDAGVLDHDVSAVQQWVANTGVFVVARSTDSNNYLCLGPQSSGTTYSLFKVVAGTATQLATTTVTTAASTDFTARIKVTDRLVSCYRNGTLVFTYDLTGDAHEALFTDAAATLVGVRSSRQSAATHHYTKSVTVRES